MLLLATQVANNSVIVNSNHHFVDKMMIQVNHLQVLYCLERMTSKAAVGLDKVPSQQFL